MRDVWHARQAGRPNPVVLVAVGATQNGSGVLWVGPDAASLDVLELDWTTARALIAGAAEQPAGPAAVRYLIERLPRDGEEGIPGINNLGMFAAHALIERARDFPEWESVAPISKTLRAKSGRALVEALGYTVEQTGQVTEVLRSEDDRATAIAVFLDQGEAPDAAAARFGGQTPVGAALARAERDNIPFVLITRGSSIRLHVTGRLQGVGRKGPAETLVQADMSLLREEHLPYVPLIFGAKALADGGSFERLLSLSRDYSAALSTRLRERIYTDVVPKLAVGLANARGQGVDLDDIYEETLVLLFRLLFVAYAEDRDLLPYRTNKRYRDASLKSMARSLSDIVEEGRSFETDKTDSLWQDCFQLFSAVDKGSPTWDVPAYNGGLFSSDEAVNKAGSALAGVSVANSTFGPALTALLTEPGTQDGVTGPVDFRSLSVRDFGTIYEGLLESGISEAPEDLTLDARGNYVPATGKTPVVQAGDIYHHNRGGARKSTGSYFTKDFAVEHLLDHALVPAVNAHLERVRELVDAGNASSAAEVFFDFRCADLAMGSGHFLVAAVDKIEEQFSRFLDEHPVDGVLAELDRLRDAAHRGLGDSAALYEIERRALLRRQIARRCIYGVDVNRIAVELAQLALWVHTFVPGLALTYLGHNLVHGNSLTGIGTVDEAADALDDPSGGGRVSIFSSLIQDLLARAIGPLHRLARANDATRADMEEVYEAQAEASKAAEPARMLFDLVCAQRRGETSMVELARDESAIEGHPGLPDAEQRSAELGALHFPIAFPEVFLRERGGFDCIVGNPPWDKVRFEAQQFWVTRDPGLNALSVDDRKKRIDKLRRDQPDQAVLEDAERAEREAMQLHFDRSFQLQGSGHHELAKAFVERALRLSQHAVGLVLPRQSMVLRGWQPLRAALVAGAETHLTQARNTGGWLFDDVEARYMIVLLARTVSSAPMLSVMPAVESRTAFDHLALISPIQLTGPELEGFGTTAAIPWVSSAAGATLLQRMVPFPTLSGTDGWVSGRSETRYDFSGSGKLKHFARRPPGDSGWKVLQTKHVGRFGLDWTQPPLATVDDVRGVSRLVAGLEVNAQGVIELGARHPSIIFRYPSRNDDSRTVIASGLPRLGCFPTTGYVHAVRTEGAEAVDVLALLGYLNSLVCDWWARRFVDRHVTAPVINNLRLPDWDLEKRKRVAACVETVLHARGVTALSGGIDVGPRFEPDDSVAEAEALIDAAAAKGFGLSWSEMETVLSDFSLRAVTVEHREKVLAHLGKPS
jgi:hypothetical protein